MPKSYELKLREAELLRRPKPKCEQYAAIDGVSQRICIGFDHPETLHLEMQLTWVYDTWTVEETHDHLMGEVRRLDMEYRRKPVRGNYSMKYLWFDRFVLRPRVNGVDLTLQDYGIEPGFQLKVAPYYTAERMWGEPNTLKPQLGRTTPEQLNPCDDPALLVRLDKGSQVARTRVYCFPWLGSQSTGYMAVARQLPQDVGCYALELPGRLAREHDEGYPTGAFAVEVMCKTLAKELRKPGDCYFLAHSQGSHLAYYVAKVLTTEFNVRVGGLFVSCFDVPASMKQAETTTLEQRRALCVPLRIFTGLIKNGWGLDPKMGYKSHMGYMAYQHQDTWPAAKKLLVDWWLTKDFPLPGSDDPINVPIGAFHARDDAAVSLEQVKRWRQVTRQPEKFELNQLDGDHMWITSSSRHSEVLANHMMRLIRKWS